MFSVDECKIIFLNFLKLSTKYSDRTVKSYEIDLTQFINFFKERTEDDKPEINAVNEAYIVSFREEITTKGLKNSTIARKLTALRTVFRFLCCEKIILGNPTVSIANPVIPLPFPQEISLGRINHAIQDISEDTFINTRDRAILEVFYSSGIRLGELVELKLTSLDLNLGLLIIGDKIKEFRTTPTGLPAIKALYLYMTKRDLLLIELGIEESPVDIFLSIHAKKLSARAIQQRVFCCLQKFCEKKKSNPNMLRQSFKKHLLESGPGLASVRYMLGQVVASLPKILTKLPIETMCTMYLKAHPRSD